ncbi:MAG: hypothetical protein AB1505_31750, partial [Candidatus Latescibacterota bacterium]
MSTHPPGRLLATIDCTAEYGADRYFAHGETRVVETAAGCYREAGDRPVCRFGYRFAVEHAGQPHLAVIRYPDDRRRFMTLMDGTGYDLSTGILTGGPQPVSLQMLELRQVFWPRWTDCSLVFTTWSNGEPAAAASLEVYELADLPPLPVPADPGDGSRRELGVQYEDPCGTGASEGAQSRQEWAEHVVQYMCHTGQNLLVYPLVWYHGPQYPSAREPADAFDVVVGRDRRQYSRWTTHPAEWVAPLLERMGAAGLQFQAALTLLRLGSLMQRMNTDPEAVRAGADTLNNVRSTGQIQGGTGDWTVVYNARNYARLVEYHVAGRDQSDFPWAYGEKGPPSPGPIFSPLHPVVQEAIVGLVGEIAQRYGPYPAFRGLSLNLWHSTFLWFASLDSGYDDLTVRRFTEDTGIEIPVDRLALDRFTRRYRFLTSVCRPAWIRWRCCRIRDLVRRLRDAVTAARSDLRLVLTLWDETTVPQLLGWATAAHQLGARPGLAELYREGGIDVDLYRDEPGVEVDLGMGNTRDRGGHPPDSTSGVDAALASTTMYRDHDFLDRATLAALAAQRCPGAFIFNCWVEAWGVHRWFPCGADDEQARALAVMDGEPAEGIFRINSEYPPDGFWWGSQLRITPAFPAGDHFMEPYAHALAELDACRITRGGLFLDKAHGEAIGRFAAAFRALPRRRFATVGASTDPVAVRQLACEGKRFVYLVNREYYPVEVEIELAGEPGKVVDLATGAAAEPSDSAHPAKAAALPRTGGPAERVGPAPAPTRVRDAP